MKRKVAMLITSIVLIVALVCTGITIAFFIDKDRVVNVFETGTLDTDNHENSKPTPSEENELPDGNKVVQVENIQNDNAIDAYVRVTLVPTWTEEDALRSGTLSAPIGNRIAFDSAYMRLNESWQNDWIYQGGYFYYKHVLKPGEKTSNLLEEVVVTNSEASISNLKITVLSDAVQAGGNAIQDAWPEAPALDSYQP